MADRKFLQAISTDPKARELMKGMKEPENAKEAAALYQEVAEKLGYQVTKNDIKTMLTFLEKTQQEQTAKTEGSVKEALDESALEAIAGGGEDSRCADSFNDDWCWFTDACSFIINFYEKEVKVDYSSWECVNESFADTSADKCGSTYVELDEDIDW